MLGWVGGGTLVGGAPMGGDTLVGGAPKIELFELETFETVGLLDTVGIHENAVGLFVDYWNML